MGEPGRDSHADPGAAGRRVRTGPALAVLLVGVLSVAPAVASTTDDRTDRRSDGSITVTVPQIPYTAAADEFLVGPQVSLLDVLVNDSGPREPSSLRLLDGRGRAVEAIQLPQVGRLDVVEGRVRLTGVTNPRGEARFRYRASDPFGVVSDAGVLVRAGRGIAAVDDEVIAVPGSPVQVDVGANDLLLQTTAVLSCLPRLTLTPPPRRDVVTIVPPLPARSAPRGCPTAEPLVTREGTWTVDGRGMVAFSPVGRRPGSVSVFYEQDTQDPGDSAYARVRVRYDGSTQPGATPTPTGGADPGPVAPSPSPGGTTTGPAPSPTGGGTGADGDSRGGRGEGPGGGVRGADAGGRGPLARTGIDAWGMLVVGTGLLAAGAVLGVGVRRTRGGRRAQDSGPH